FGTLLSSQGTDASFVLTSAHRLKLSSGLRSSFPTLSDPCGPDFLGAFQVPAFAFPFPAIPTLSDPFGPDPSQRALPWGLLALAASETVADSSPLNQSAAAPFGRGFLIRKYA
ncbi:hypothetical protein, partial [Streptomyces sp. NPDC006341]